MRSNKNIRGIIFTIYTLLVIFNSCCLVWAKKTSSSSSPFGKITKTVEYDYVVLGAGTAGSTVASKLSTNSKNSVLLVEDGKYATHPLIWEPNGWADNWIFNYQPDYAKSFFTTPNEHVANRSIELRRGVGTGGSNMINAMIYQVGVKNDYDQWVKHTGGDLEWDYDHSIRPIVKQELEKAFNIRVNDNNRVFMPDMKSVLEEVGFTYSPDIDTHLGHFLDRRFIQSFDNQTGHWKRQTSYSQFIDNVVSERSNLDVMTSTKALKLDIDSSNKKNGIVAKGVYLLDKIQHRVIYVKIRKQVIVSMGAYDSPLFLQFSGIGDWESLRKAGIKPVLHSPYVGKNLYDHMFSYILGPLVSDAYSHVKPSDFIHDTPTDGYVVYGPLPTTTSNSQNSTIKWILNPDMRPFMGDLSRFLCFVELVAPESKGSIQITEANETEFKIPTVDKNYLSDAKDIETIIDGIKACRKIEAKLLEKGYLVGDELLPGLSATSDQALEKHIRATSLTDYHPHGTVRMGSDSTSPLTSRLKLKGSQNINVIDASVIPKSPSANTNIPTVIIAIKGSKFILDQENN